MRKLQETLRNVKATLNGTNPDTIGTVVGIRRIWGPRQNLVNIVKSGNGNCATEDAIKDFTGYPMSVNEPYINDLIEHNVFERRPITRPKTGEVVNLICITDEGKAK